MSEYYISNLDICSNFRICHIVANPKVEFWDWIVFIAVQHFPTLGSHNVDSIQHTCATHLHVHFTFSTTGISTKWETNTEMYRYILWTSYQVTSSLTTKHLLRQKSQSNLTLSANRSLTNENVQPPPQLQRNTNSLKTSNILRKY